MANAKTLDAKINAIAQAVVEHLELAGHNELSAKLLATLGELAVRPVGRDGRATAWSEERRAKFGEKISKAWEEKRKAQSSKFVLHRYQYSDVKPELLDGLAAIAKKVGLQERTVQNKLIESPDGFIVKEGRFNIIYASNSDAFDRLCHGTFFKTHNEEDIIRLPSKKHKSF